MPTLETLPGDNLSVVVRKARALVITSQEPVTFTFNGVPIVVREGDTQEAIESAFHAEMDRQAAEWKASPEGQAAEANQALQLAKLQVEHDHLMFELPTAFGDDTSTIRWLMRYADPADDMGVKGRDFNAVAAALEVAGYRRNDALGLGEDADSDPRTMARYLVGQAIDQLRSGMPPHPGMMEKFGSSYLRAISETI